MAFAAVERLIAFRYLRARREEGFISVIAGFSLVGIALGVGTLIVVMAVMNGFRVEMLRQMSSISGQLGVQGTRDGARCRRRELLARMQGRPGRGDGDADGRGPGDRRGRRQGAGRGAARHAARGLPRPHAALRRDRRPSRCARSLSQPLPQRRRQADRLGHAQGFRRRLLGRGRPPPGRPAERSRSATGCSSSRRCRCRHAARRHAALGAGQGRGDLLRRHVRLRRQLRLCAAARRAAPARSRRQGHDHRDLPGRRRAGRRGATAVTQVVGPQGWVFDWFQANYRLLRRHPGPDQRACSSC